MQKALIWLSLFVVGAAGGAGILWLGVRGRLAPGANESAVAEPAKQGEEESASAPAAAEGQKLIQLDAETQERVGLRVEPLEAVRHQPEALGYGALQEDPRRSFTLRAPVAGTVRAPAGGRWPELGQSLAADDLAGSLEPRLTPTERIDLSTRLTQARADAAEAEAALATARTSYENKKRLNADGKAVSDRVLEEAETKVKSEEARLHAATSIVHLIEAAQSTVSGATAPLELRPGRAGEVVESPVQPGETVEPGQVLLRMADFGVLIARVAVPLGIRLSEPFATARITPVGEHDVTLAGRFIGLGVGATPADRGLILLFRVDAIGRALRPGTPVLAYLPAPGGERSGVLVPRSAVVRIQGLPWVYVQIDDEHFERRELTHAEPMDEGWFTSVGLAPGDPAVVEGAQVLLSEELKAEIERAQSAAE